MILVIGGAYQGKLELVFSWRGQDPDPVFYADGGCDSWEAATRKTIIYRFHEYLRRGLQEQKDMNEWVKQLIYANPDFVIMDEVGYGIVPVEREDRIYRELVGYAGQQLAKEAEAVYRVVCGIPVKIK